MSTIEEVQKAKDELSERIASQIIDFEKTFNVLVEDIGLKRYSYVMGNRFTRLDEVELTIKI